MFKRSLLVPVMLILNFLLLLGGFYWLNAKSDAAQIETANLFRQLINNQQTQRSVLSLISGEVQVIKGDVQVIRRRGENKP